MPSPPSVAPGSAGPGQPPADPRTSWNLPPLGTLPPVARFDELVTRVLAPNPSLMTLDGTNSYVVSASGSGEAALVDPGPGDPLHLARVEEVLAALDVECRWIVLTHGHPDHAEAAASWAERFDAQVAAVSPSAAGPRHVPVAAGDRLSVGGTTLRVVPTPGHTADHIALRLENGCVLVGDAVLGRGTSIVDHPEGDLRAYLDSLRRLLDLGSAALYPGHGPELRKDPAAVVGYYLAHRNFREQQILSFLQLRPAGATAGEVVRHIYSDVDPAVWPAAERTSLAALEKLRIDGVVAMASDGTARLVVDRTS